MWSPLFSVEEFGRNKGMKTLIAALGLCLAGISASAQYSIDWHTIDGGGGTSTGGVFSVSGTIGQPDAGRMIGGNYTIEGGFWSIIAAVQTEGAPLLTVTLTPTNSVVISWPYPATGYSLEQNVIVSGGTWGSIGTAPVQVADRWQVIVAPPAGNRFYRLKK